MISTRRQSATHLRTSPTLINVDAMSNDDDYRQEAESLLARSIYTGELEPIEAVHHLQQFSENALSFEEARDLIYDPNGVGETIQKNFPELFK